MLLNVFVQRTDASACGDEKKTFILQHDEHVEVEDEVENKQKEQPSPTEADQRTDTQTKTSSENCQESPTFSSEISTLTEESSKQEEDLIKCKSHEEQDGKVEILSSAFYSNFLGKKKKKKSNNSNIEKMGTPSSFSSSTYSSQSSFEKSKSYSSGTSKMLRNLITCGPVDTNDAVLVALNKSSSKYPTNKSHDKAEICKGETFGGSSRVFGAPWNQPQQQQHSAWYNKLLAHYSFKISVSMHKILSLQLLKVQVLRAIA